jgi:PAS domain S-box-containing protein
VEERRRQQSPTDTEGYLRQLPSLTLLARLPIAMLGVGQRGEIAYANPAFTHMLGYSNPETITGLDLPTLLSGHEEATPQECLHKLRTTTTVIEWNHDQSYVIRTMLSAPLLLRATDTLHLIGITDVTAWLWETRPAE